MGISHGNNYEPQHDHVERHLATCYACARYGTEVCIHTSPHGISIFARTTKVLSIEDIHIDTLNRELFYSEICSSVSIFYGVDAVSEYW